MFLTFKLESRKLGFLTVEKGCTSLVIYDKPVKELQGRPTPTSTHQHQYSLNMLYVARNCRKESRHAHKALFASLTPTPSDATKTHFVDQVTIGKTPITAQLWEARMNHASRNHSENDLNFCEIPHLITKQPSDSAMKVEVTNK